MDDTINYSHRVERRVRTSHGDVLRTIDRCADATVAVWDGPGVTERRQVVEPFSAALDERGVTDRLPDVLVDLVEAVGHDLTACPVPAPPYVVVASTGVLLRATIPPGRLIIAVEPFEVTGRSSPTYRRRDQSTLDVRIE